MKAIFILLLSISLILTQNTNKIHEKQEKKKSEEETSTLKDANLNSTNLTSSKRTPRRKSPLNMTVDEMDRILLCTTIVQDIIKQKNKNMQEVNKKLNLSNINMLIEKVGTDTFEKCTKTMDMKTVNKYFKNLTLIKGYEWEKSFDKYLNIDFDKYHNESDLAFTKEQQLLMNKFSKVNSIFNLKRREKYENENRKIKIANVDFESIPLSFKLGIFLVILVLFFGGIFYFLKTLEKKPKDKKKKERKEKKN